MMGGGMGCKPALILHIVFEDDNTNIFDTIESNALKSKNRGKPAIKILTKMNKNYHNILEYSRIL